jgi:transketolase
MEKVIGKPNLTVFSETLVDLGKENQNLFVVTSDSRGSGKLVPFGEAFPDQIVEVGIAEQNLVGIAAGLASAGKTVFAVSPASFLTARALEQIKNDVAYADNNVNLVGISSGVSYGALGATHHTIHDYAVLRCINNLTVVAPGDNFEAREAVRAAAQLESPVYLRFGKRVLEDVHHPDEEFVLGKAITVRDGTDAAIIATGETLFPALEAADLLAGEGISCRVVSMHTVKPLDTEAMLSAAKDCGAVVTVEEHSVFGGLGEACASVLARSAFRGRFEIIGLPDEYLVNGSQLEMYEHYGINSAGIQETVKRLLS